MDETAHAGDPDIPAAPPRRGFLRGAGAIIAGAIAIIIPGGAGLAVLIDPLRKRPSKADFLRITTLDALPADGSPRQFPVITDKTDAWNRYPNTRIGAVYLQRDAKDHVTAFNVSCPHAGCFVDAIPGGGFHCPCHKSHFNADGSVSPGSPSPRGLDELEVNPIALKGGVVEVRFQNFIAGTVKRTPRS